MASSFCTLFLLLSFCAADGDVGLVFYRCLFNSTALKDIQYIQSMFYRRVEFLRFDSNAGNYSGYTEFGMSYAEKFNNDPGVMDARRVDKDLFCLTIADLWYRNILTRSVKPSVALRSVTPPAGPHPAMLVCDAYDFYPKRIKVTWLRDGQEVTSDVTSTDELASGNWLYQIHSHLEYTPRFGEKISCMVEHVSLSEPLIQNWEMSESDKNKMATGASGLVLGVTTSLAGFIYYKRKSRGLILVRT